MEAFENQEAKGMAIQIIEFNTVVRQYHDIDKERFLKIAREMIDNHLSRHSSQAQNEVKNITINIYTIG